MLGSKVYDNTYTYLKGKLSCNRLMNEFEQIGCQSPRAGAAGVLYKVASQSDITFFLANAPKDSYIPLVATSVFANNASLNTLLASNWIAGLLVYDDGQAVKWSPDDVLPNRNHGLPYATSSPWNSVGGGFNRHLSNFSEGSLFLEYSVPIFFLDPSDNTAVFQCYNTNNKITNGMMPSYPQCGVELNSFMWGAKDTSTCLRRGYCDALANQSPYAFMRVLGSSEQVVMISAQIDSVSFFHDLSYGAEADASGVVVALAAAELLGRVNNSAVRSLPRNIMFSLFHGESFGYIGSSRVAYDIVNKNFPSSSNSLSFDRISHFLELNQLALGGSAVSLFAHNNASSGVQDIKTALQLAITTLNSPYTLAQQSSELPPASLRSFLAEMTPAQQSAFCGAVLAGFPATNFTNQVYHSHLDNAANIGYTTSNATVIRLCKLAAVVAKAAWALAAGVSSINASNFTLPDENADCTMISNLLTCMTVDQNCSYAQSFASQLTPAGRPLSRYIGIFPSGMDPGTGFLFKVLAYSAASDRNAQVSSTDCVAKNNPAAAQYYPSLNKACVQTATYTWPALSPAFFADGGALRPVGAVTQGNRNARYSTWTEARWGSVSMRMFLMDSPDQQARIIGGGVAALVISFLTVFLAQRYIALPASS